MVPGSPVSRAGWGGERHCPAENVLFRDARLGARGTPAPLAIVGQSFSPSVERAGNHHIDGYCMAQPTVPAHATRPGGTLVVLARSLRLTRLIEAVRTRLTRPGQQRRYRGGHRRPPNPGGRDAAENHPRRRLLFSFVSARIRSTASAGEKPWSSLADVKISHAPTQYRLVAPASRHHLGWHGTKCAPERNPCASGLPQAKGANGARRAGPRHEGKPRR